MATTKTKRELSPEQHQKLLAILKTRFEKNTGRHKSMEWKTILTRLETMPEKLWSLNEMEQTGGEPDVIIIEEQSDEYLFVDCSPETPSGRRSICYDNQALESRKEHKPKNSAVGMATDMGIDLISEEQYRQLQTLGVFDTKTSSWINTPAAIRNLGGALFCDRRYDHVFLYHNGAESYYGARGFRGFLLV